jgi:hypothetical protein
MAANASPLVNGLPVGHGGDARLRRVSSGKTQNARSVIGRSELDCLSAHTAVQKPLTIGGYLGAQRRCQGHSGATPTRAAVSGVTGVDNQLTVSQ